MLSLLETQREDFNPRSPRGGATVRYPNGYTYNADFNPRSPRGGATLGRREADAQAGEFQSTLPTRGSDRMARMTQ